MQENQNKGKIGQKQISQEEIFSEFDESSQSKRSKKFGQESKTYSAFKSKSSGKNLRLQENVNAITQTPTERVKICTTFELGSLSPVKKFTKSTEHEMRRFSYAVHLWADRKCGGVMFLQQVRLTDKHFKQILEFAGPKSKLNILKDRLPIQLKRMWRNSTKGKQKYRGSYDTGYETKLQLHAPNSPFCPFEHCTPGLMNHLDSIPCQTLKGNSLKVGRKLFSPNKKLEPDYNREFSESTTNKLPVQEKTFGELPPNQEMRKENISINDPGNPSPTKLELMRHNVNLQQELEALKESIKDDNMKKEMKSKVYASTSDGVLLRCTVQNCGKSFSSTFGLHKHEKIEHRGEIIETNKLFECYLCGKHVKYLDHHINFVHKENRANTRCQVCQKIILTNMKKHRGSCNVCPYCDHKERKKDRLLKHISSCTQKHKTPSDQTEPWDLSTPEKKKVKENKNETNLQKHNTLGDQSTKLDGGKSTKNFCKNNMEFQSSVFCDVNNEEVKITDGEMLPSKIDAESDKDLNEAVLNLDETIIDLEKGSKQKRLKFPFDSVDSNEAYISELEDTDEEEFTIRRRNVKDSLELELRRIDAIENLEFVGDDEVVNRFREFEQIKKKRAKSDGEFSKLKQVSTIELYTAAVKKHIIPAFHRVVSPFDARWLLDCTTPKTCTIEGEPRRFVNQEEPIYMTTTILKEALKQIDSYGGESGSQRGALLAATSDFLDFIELTFNSKMGVYGPGPTEKLLPYHAGVRNFLKSTGAWKLSNEEKEKAHQTKKIIENYENPLKDKEILENYKKYLKSTDRLSNFTRVLEFSSEETPLPSEGEFTGHGNFTMGEIVTSTGVRPTVVLRLTMVSYVDKTPGFNPREVSEGDCVTEEEFEDDKIFRRVNPNLPPKHRACKHQIAENTAQCSVQCDDRCEPDGFNVLVTWDKTQNSKGSSYLHITRPLKVLMDSYSLLRSRFFQNRKPSFTQNDDWISEDDAPFFLKSSGSAFNFLDLKHLSESMKCDVTAYSFRRIVCTWAITHENKDIQDAEEETLQHGLQVARDKYLQSKQMKPQKLTQTYAQEENLFSKAYMDEIEKTELFQGSKIKETDEKRAKKRYENLMNAKHNYKKSLSENKALGPKHRVLVSDRNKFKELLQDIQNEKVEKLITELKPMEWRKFLVRLVCTTKGQEGCELRNLWTKIYMGDMKWGVRDARMKAKMKNWKANQLHDRNSWISSSIRKSLLTEKKRCDKISYMKTM